MTTGLLKGRLKVIFYIYTLQQLDEPYVDDQFIWELLYLAFVVIYLGLLLKY